MKNLILIAFSLLSIQSAFCQTGDHIKVQVGWESVTLKNKSLPVVSDPLQCQLNDIDPLPHTISSEGISQLGGLDFTKFNFNNKINQMANMVAGVYSPYGETPSIIGAQASGTAYYIDGVRVVEGFLPQLFQ